MGAWAGPFLIAAVLLAGAGVAKAIDPTATVGALLGFGWRVPRGVVRVGGVLEAAVAVVAGVTGNPVAALLVAASYVAFTAFVVVALARHRPIGSCGCFGKVDTPPSVLHLVVNLGATVAAVGVAANGDGGGLGTALAAQPLGAVPFVGLVVVGGYAAFTVLTVVPQLRTLRTERHP
jgi:hypothetical protein